MRSLMIIAAVIVTAVFSTPLMAADVGVSVSIGQPGFYGRIDIGDYPYPQPRVIYTRPRVVERVYIEREPIYMRVPPGHAKNWRKYCRRYNACGERVYFVQDNWYNQEYAPRYREHHRAYQDDHHDGYRDDYRGNQKNNHPGKGNDRDRNH